MARTKNVSNLTSNRLWVSLFDFTTNSHDSPLQTKKGNGLALYSLKKPWPFPVRLMHNTFQSLTSLHFPCSVLFKMKSLFPYFLYDNFLVTLQNVNFYFINCPGKMWSLLPRSSCSTLSCCYNTYCYFILTTLKQKDLQVLERLGEKSVK